MEKREQDTGNREAIALNQTLIDELKKRGRIQTASVEAAFREVLRHQFLPETPLEDAYADRAISAKQDQNGKWISSSSQPAMMATMLEQLGLQPGHRVLEIGAGTGYNAALMAHIVGETGQIVTIDIEQDLAEAARERLVKADLKQVQVICADGGYGYPDGAPFDRIILTVGAPDITPAWWDQIKPDGRIVLPLVLKSSMKSISFEQAKDHLTSISVVDCGFMPLRGEFAATFSDRVQLGPDRGLYLEPAEKFAIDSNSTYALLTGASKDWPTGVEVTAWDVMTGTLWTWLSLREPQLCQLVAEGDMVERNLVPPLVGIEEETQRSTSTALLFDEAGLAGLTRPPDQPVQLVERKKLFAPDSPFVLPFELFVRQYGPDASIAERLIAQIKAWDAAGPPSSGEMHVRVYPKDVEYKPSKGEYLIEKQWTKLVIEWPAKARKGDGWLPDRSIV